MARFKTINLARKQEEDCRSHYKQRHQAEKTQNRAMEGGNSNLDSNNERNHDGLWRNLDKSLSITALRRDSHESNNGCGFKTRLPVRCCGTGETKKTTIFRVFYLLYFLVIFATPGVNCDVNKEKNNPEEMKAAVRTENHVQVNESISSPLKASMKSLSHVADFSRTDFVPTRLTDSYVENTDNSKALPMRSQKAIDDISQYRRANSDIRVNSDLRLPMDTSGSHQNMNTQSYKDRSVTDDDFGVGTDNVLFGASSLNSGSEGFDLRYSNPYSSAPRSLFSSNTKFPETGVFVIADPPLESKKFSSRFKFPEEEKILKVVDPRVKSLAEAIKAIKMQAHKNNSWNHSYPKEGQANIGMDFKDFLSNHRVGEGVTNITNDKKESTSQASISVSSHLYPVYVSYQQNHGDDNRIGTNPQSRLHQDNRFYQRGIHHDQHRLSGKLREVTSKGRSGDITDLRKENQDQFDSPHFTSLPKDASQHKLLLKDGVLKEEGKYFKEESTESQGHTANLRLSPKSILQSHSQMSRPASSGSRTPYHLVPRTPYQTSTRVRTPSIPRGHYRHSRARDLAPQGSSAVDQVSRSYGMIFMPTINLSSLEGLSIITLATYMVRVFARLVQIRMSGRRRKRSEGPAGSGWSDGGGWISDNDRTGIGGSGRIDYGSQRSEGDFGSEWSEWTGDGIVEGSGNGTPGVGRLTGNSIDGNGTHDIGIVNADQLWWKGDNDWQEKLANTLARAVEAGAGWLLKKHEEWRKRLP